MWVYKFDGTQQCGLGKEVPLSEMATEITTLGISINKSEKRSWPGFIIQVCGAPTGGCNVYEISDASWKTHERQLAAAGFHEWPTVGAGGGGIIANAGDMPFPLSPITAFASMSAGYPNSRQRVASGDPDPWPWRSYTSVAPNISNMLGKYLRVYRQNDLITQDHRLDRVNIVLHPTSYVIIDVWFG